VLAFGEHGPNAGGRLATLFPGPPVLHYQVARAQLQVAGGMPQFRRRMSLNHRSQRRA
jgi:hypothetical protein